MKKPAVLLLVCVLSLPVSSPVHASMDDMFGVMFRMMLVMMNVMSDSMLGNNNSGLNNWGNNWGGLNSFNMGMSAMPMMSGFGSPWNSFGGSPWGASPWNSFGGSPMGMSPWGASPWNSFGGSPWDRRGSGPYAGRYPGVSPALTLLNGRWYGNTGEVLEIYGNRFQLRTAGASIGGRLHVQDNILTLYSPQTNTATRYTYLLNQSALLLNNGSGTLLTFRKVSPYGGMGIFR